MKPLRQNSKLITAYIHKLGKQEEKTEINNEKS